jgi:hypothetical protein
MNFSIPRVWLRRLVWISGCVVASVVTLYLLFCAGVNYFGAKRWAAAQAMLQREGESIDIRKIAPEPVLPEKNFCAIPALKDIVLVVDRNPDNGAPAERRKRLDEAGLPEGKYNRASPRPRQDLGVVLGKPTDLKAWADWLRKEGSLSMPAESANAAGDVLTALSQHDALIAELAAGLIRTEAQWTPPWKTCELPQNPFEIALPHYQATQHLVPTLTLRAIAAARAGDATIAHESLLIALRVARASLGDPLLIGALVTCSQAQLACGGVWELCDAHAGGTADFQRLEQELARFDFRAGLLLAFRGELAESTETVFWFKKSRDTNDAWILTDRDGWGSAEWSVILNLAPGGWFDMNVATIAELEFGHMIKPLRDGGLRAGQGEGESLESILKKRKASHQLDSIFACLTISTMLKVKERVAYTQCLVNQAIVACALERHRIEHGAYPGSLDAVKLSDGQPLPLDVANDRPMGYRTTADGRYALWCAGFDGKDDGGKRVLDEKKPESTRFHDEKYAGDWVWDYPAR